MSVHGTEARSISALTACKRHTSALPVLMYPKVHSAPVLELHHFRRVIAKMANGLRARDCSMKVA
ncbi:hypothetical protein F9K72_07015 [Brucella intermedia]|nr:hypothetical protein F9K72_07015 [Brucella intermedia]KAB2713380.1 hypothetical protein F9K80_01840 [Brucella intermedia]MPR62588.1 hypothetical protein [Brucella intermedia]